MLFAPMCWARPAAKRDCASSIHRRGLLAETSQREVIDTLRSAEQDANEFIYPRIGHLRRAARALCERSSLNGDEARELLAGAL
jgi:hypothetical protein